MLLAGSVIRELIKSKQVVVNPFDVGKLGPVSVPLRLGGQVLNPETGESDELQNYHLKPGQFVLVNTLEYVSLPSNIAGRVVGRASLARLGVSVVGDAQLVEPGFSGNLSLHLVNYSCREVLLKKELAACHLLLEKVEGETGEKEDGLYENGEMPEESRLCQEMHQTDEELGRIKI